MRKIEILFRPQTYCEPDNPRVIPSYPRKYLNSQMLCVFALMFFSENKKKKHKFKRKSHIYVLSPIYKHLIFFLNEKVYEKPLTKISLKILIRISICRLFINIYFELSE